MKTQKECKGIGKARGYGCGMIVPIAINNQSNRQYGLGKSCGCFFQWLKSSSEGLDYAIKQVPSKSKKSAIESERMKSMRIETYGKENRKKLAQECQRLARMIDAKFYNTCIDCGNTFGKQVDGGHFHSKGANASLQWNLHNIHSQASNCNQNGLGGGKQLGYYEGLQQRYGKEYSDFVRFDLTRLYPTVKLSNQEVYEKLAIARKLVRDFNTYVFNDARQAREMFNKIIGIYQ